MRNLALVPLLLALVACDVPMPTSQRSAAATTPFNWKGNTPRVTRAYDLNECELAGRGLTLTASDSQIAAASASLSPEQIAAGVNQCLAAKGYTQVDMPVCTADDRALGMLVVGADVLPPLESIRCLDPVAKGMIVA